MPTHHRAPNSTHPPARPTSINPHHPVCCLNHHRDCLPHHHFRPLEPIVDYRAARSPCHPPCSNLYTHLSTGHVHRDGRQTESHTAQPRQSASLPRYSCLWREASSCANNHWWHRVLRSTRFALYRGLGDLVLVRPRKGTALVATA
ncbi:hypothetical protein CGRA01v4_04161 [Colletotrichum graminicola]|nr:hypothetical protein CGRA01v4_04161 [Colletotrichum graminicola]